MGGEKCDLTVQERSRGKNKRNIKKIKEMLKGKNEKNTKGRDTGKNTMEGTEDRNKTKTGRKKGKSSHVYAQFTYMNP